jgi:branched-chain amino acid aminotransferase
MATQDPAYLWWNGEQCRWEDANVHVTMLGASTIGAVFEGIRAYWNPKLQESFIFRLPEHLERLFESMKVMRYRQDYSAEQLTEAIKQLVLANEHRHDIYIRPLAYRGDNNPGLTVHSAEAAILINTSERATQLLTGRTQHACISSWTRISDNVMPPRVKNISNYRNSQLANMEATVNGYDVALLLNDQGKVAEGPAACLMMVRHGRLITPDITSSILESITRDSILTMAREDLGLEVIERPVERTELYLADELFLCGTAAEITPVVSVDRYQVGTGEPGPITRRLEQLFIDVLRGDDPRHADWRTPVGLPKLATA